MSSEPQESAGESANFLAFDKTNEGNNRGYRQNSHQYRPYNRHQNYRNQNFRRNQQQYQQFGGPQQNDDDRQFAPSNYSSPVHHQQRFNNGGGGFHHRPNHINQQFQHRRNFVPFNVKHIPNFKVVSLFQTFNSKTICYCLFAAIRWRWRQRWWWKFASSKTVRSSNSTIFSQKYD